MADTGAPHFIPYVEPTDLVRDYPAADEASADAIAAALDAIPVPPGIGSNVVSVTKTNIFSTTSTSFASITGLAVTITPTTNTSKVLLIASINHSHSGNFTAGFLRMSGGNSASYIGDARGTRTRAVQGWVQTSSLDLAQASFLQSMVLVDAPATTSAVTYQIEGAVNGNGTLIVNTRGNDSDNPISFTGASTLTAIEVAA